MQREILCKTFDVIIPFSPVLYNTLLYFHHSNILRSHLALAEHDVPYLATCAAVSASPEVITVRSARPDCKKQRQSESLSP